MLRPVGWTSPNGIHIQENFNIHNTDTTKSNHALFIYVSFSDIVSSSR